jgi:hypothetical protein
MQFGEGPLRGVPVGAALLLRRLLAVLALGAVPNAGALFQPEESVRMGVQDAFGDRLGGIQRSPVSLAAPG